MKSEPKYSHWFCFALNFSIVALAIYFRLFCWKVNKYFFSGIILPQKYSQTNFLQQ